MYSTSHYLLSGVQAVSTGDLSVLGMDKFTFNMTVTAGAQPATGTVNLLGRLSPSESYTNFYSKPFENVTVSSGQLCQADGPFESIRATVSPWTNGIFTTTVRYCGSKG